MATISKDKNRWRAMVRRQGHKPISKNFKTQAEAKRWARDIEKAVDEGDVHTLTTKTVADLVDRYIDENTDEEGVCSLPVYEVTVLKWWKDTIGKQRLSHIRKAHIVDARKIMMGLCVKKGPNKGEKLTPATVNRRVALLSRVCQIAQEEWDWMGSNPCRIKSLTEDGERDRVLGKDERAKLLKALRAHYEPCLMGFVMVADSTGMRASEIQRIRWEHLDLVTGCIQILKSKNSEKRAVFVGGDALAWLKAWRADTGLQFGGYVFGNAITKQAPYNYRVHWGQVKAKAGIKDMRFHDLRHGFVTSALGEAKMNPVMVQLVTGHKSTAMLKRYAHLSTEVAQQIASGVDKARAEDEQG